MSPLKERSSAFFLGIIVLLITPVCSQEIGEASIVPTVHARVGETVLLPCPQELHTPAPPLPVALYLLQWERTGSSYPFFVLFDSKSPFIDEHFAGRVSIPSEDDAGLQITNVTIADAGSYECKVTDLITGDVGGSENGTFVNLVILYPPELGVTPPPSIVFPRGDPQSLHCQAEGVPTPVVTWYREGQQLRSSRYMIVQGGTITLEAVRREDGGSYVCKAENSEGSVQDNTRVIVEGAPYIFMPPHDVTVLRGQLAKFGCEYGASPSNVSQRWYYEDTMVQELPQFAGRYSSLLTGGLTIDDVDASDEGRYSCSPTNAIGVPPVASGHLTVQYPASVVSMPSQVFAARSDPVTIPCHSDAKPAVLRYVWRKNQREIIITHTTRYSVSEGGNLTIHSSEYSDIGAYSCIPYNAVGTDGPSNAAILRVIEKPSFQTRPRSTYEMLPNETVTVPCTASGTPPLDVEWRKVHGSIPTLRSLVTSAGLTINNLTKEDTGAYECSITNEVATVTAVTHLYIQMTTPHTPHNISVLTSSTSAYVMWYPGYNGEAEQKFTVRYKPMTTGAWSLYTDVPETVHSVLIRDLQPSTEYQFSLAGENSYGASGWSESISHETKGKNSNHTLLDNDPAATISPPRNLTVISTSESLLLSWLPPIEGASLVSHYAVEYWIKGPWLVLEDRVSADLTELLLLELTVNTTYSFRLIAFSGTSFSEPSVVVKGNTWGLSMYKPTSEPQSFDLTGVLAGVIAGVFCLLCLILLACVIISCTQRKKRNKRMVFFSVVAHSDQGSSDTHRKPTDTEKRSFCASLCCCCCPVGPEEKKLSSPGPSITVLPASLVTMPRVSKTSIGGKAGVYHVSSSEVPDATLSGSINIIPAGRKRQISEGSEAMEAEEMNRGRLLGSPEPPGSHSDGNEWGSERGSRQGRHIRFQLSSTWGAPPKPDRGDYVYYHGCMLINSAGSEPSTNTTNSRSPREKPPPTNRIRCDTPMPVYDPDEWRRDYRMYLEPYSGPSDDQRIVLDPSSGYGEGNGQLGAFHSSDSSSQEMLYSSNHFISSLPVTNKSCHAIITNPHHHPSPRTKAHSSRPSIFHGSDSGSQETLISSAMLMSQNQRELTNIDATNPQHMTNRNAHDAPGSNPDRSNAVQGIGPEDMFPLPDNASSFGHRQAGLLGGAATNTAHSSTNLNTSTSSAVGSPTDNVSYMLFLKPGRKRSKQAFPDVVTEEENHGNWRNASTLDTERGCNPRSFDPRTAVTVPYDEVTIERESLYSQDDEHNDQPSHDGDVEDNLIAYDEVPRGTDSLFHPPTVHYDDVPMEDLTYVAEELYASLRDEVPKRKFGVHEYALDDQSPDEQPQHGTTTDEDVVPELAHEYSKLERPTHPHSESLHGGVRLSNDSGMNSDNSGPSEENDPDTLKSSLRLTDTVPSRHVRLLRAPLRSSNRSLPRASISPLSILTNHKHGQRNNHTLGSLPDFQNIDHRGDVHTLSPHDSEYSASSGYGSRNVPIRPPSRSSGRLNNSTATRNLLNPIDQSGRSSANELARYDPERERELMNALQRYYESDGDLRGSQRRVVDLQEKEAKERRCANLKREFEEYRQERESGPVSPRKTTIV